MGNVTVLLALGIFGFMLLFMFFKLRNEEVGGSKHFLLQLLVLGFLLGVFLLIGKVSLDDKDICAWNVANSTTVGSTTSFSYNYDCETNPNTTSTSFYKLITWTVYIIALYIFLYFFYALFTHWGFFGKKKGGGE